MYAYLNDFDNCHHINYTPNFDDLTEIDVYTYQSSSRRKIASFATYKDAIEFASKVDLQMRCDDIRGTILVVTRSSGFILSQINVNR